MVLHYTWSQNHNSGDKKNEKSITMLFRLPQNKENNKNSECDDKLKLFIATLIHYGSKFEKLKNLLTKWDKNKSNKNLTKTEIIEIIRIKAQYDVYMNTHSINKYVDMIDNMNKEVIKPLKALVNSKEFKKMEEKEWKERSENTLQIENQWQLLLQKMKVPILCFFCIYSLICTWYANSKQIKSG